MFESFQLLLTTNKNPDNTQHMPFIHRGSEIRFREIHILFFFSNLQHASTPKCPVHFGEMCFCISRLDILRILAKSKVSCRISKDGGKCFKVYEIHAFSSKVHSHLIHSTFFLFLFILSIQHFFFLFIFQLRLVPVHSWSESFI